MLSLISLCVIAALRYSLHSQVFRVSKKKLIPVILITVTQVGLTMKQKVESLANYCN